MSIRLAIADNDSEYIRRLTDVLQEYEELQINIFESEEILLDSLSRRRFDILLFSPTVYDGSRYANNVSFPVVLYDEDLAIPEQLAKTAKIKKYQRISRIYQELLEAYAQVSQAAGNMLGQKKTKVWAYYSPIGGCGKTTLSLATAAKMARDQRSVFYLNLEDMPSDEIYLTNSMERGITDLLNGLGSGMNFAVKLKGLLQNKNERLYYTKHFDSPNDLKEVNAEELAELIREISSSGIFDYLIVDLGTRFDEKTAKVFDMADNIMIIERNDSLSEKKMSVFYSQLYIFNEYGEKMHRIVNCNMNRKDGLQPPIGLIGGVYMAQVTDPGTFIDQLASGSSLEFLEPYL